MEAADCNAQKLKVAEGTSFQVSEASVKANPCYHHSENDRHMSKYSHFREADCQILSKICHSKGEGASRTAPQQISLMKKVYIAKE